MKNSRSRAVRKKKELEEPQRRWFEFSAHPPLVRSHKKLVKEWHPSKNGNLGPDEFTFGSNERVWWKCGKCQHSWQARIEDRTIKESGCPGCNGKVPTPKNNLKALFPKVAAEWHPEKNGDLTPSKVLPKSSKKAVWFCSKNSSHPDWEAVVSNRTKGSRCPACAHSKSSADYSLAALHPELAKEWWQERNGSLTPQDVTPGSTKSVWWKCPAGPDHEWRAPVTNRTKTGKGCGFCHGLRASVTNSLVSLYPQLAEEWHHRLNTEFKLEEMVAKSPRKVWWRCKVNSRHVWEARIQDRVQKNSGCRECAGKAPKRPS